MNLVFKGFRRISLPLLFSAFAEIINLTGLQSKAQKPEYTSESPSEKNENSSETLISEMQPVVLEENKFKYAGKPKQLALLAIKIYEGTNTSNVYRKMFVKQFST